MSSPTQGLSGYGVQLQHNLGGSFATIAENVRFDAPSPELQTVDATNLNSPADIEEIIPTIIKNGECSGTCTFLVDDATQRAMVAAIYNRTKAGFKIIWNDANATAWSFNGYVLQFQPVGIVVNGKQDARFRIKPTGMITIPT